MSNGKKVLDVYFNGACPEEGNISVRHCPHIGGGETHITLSLMDFLMKSMENMPYYERYEVMGESVVTLDVLFPTSTYNAICSGKELKTGWRKSVRMLGLMLPSDQWSYKEDGGWVGLRDPSKGWRKRSAEQMKAVYQHGDFL